MKRQLEFGKDSMETLCLPLGPAYLTTRYRMSSASFRRPR